MAALILANAERTRYLLAERSEIGRSPECDLQLADASISRRHARVVFAAGGYRLSDLGSRFGSAVNDRLLAAGEEVALRPGDKVRLGNLCFEFEHGGGPAEGAPPPAAGPLAGELQRARIDVASAGTDPARLRELEAQLSELERRMAALSHAERKNRALLEVARLAGTVFDLGMLLELSADTLLRAMRGERLALLLLENGLLVQRVSRNLPAGLAPERWAPVRQALGQGTLVQVAPGADGRAACCLPLRGKQAALGAIYLELPPGRQLAPDETDLLLALGQQVALSLDNHNLLASVRQEEKRRENLSRYLSDDVVEAVLSGALRLELGGELLEASVMFVDVRGFTSISERLAPPQLLAMLNEYFSVASEAVLEADGTIDKYIGDALMAVFGAPSRCGDHAARAVRAGMRVRDAVAKLSASWRDKPWSQALAGTSFEVGIGINSGPVVAGNIGSQRRMEFTVIGDTVNLASRLCSAAARGQLLVGPATWAAVSGLAQGRALPPIKLKGKEQPVQPYEVL